MSLNASDTPDLIDEEPPSTHSPGLTLLLKFDLEIDPMRGMSANSESSSSRLFLPVVS